MKGLLAVRVQRVGCCSCHLALPLHFHPTKAKRRPTKESLDSSGTRSPSPSTSFPPLATHLNSLIPSRNSASSKQLNVFIFSGLTP